jgi:hypothetical protein
VDYFALRCGEADWLLDFSEGFRSDGSLLSLPGIAYSAAMARLGGGAGTVCSEHHQVALEKQRQRVSLPRVRGGHQGFALTPVRVASTCIRRLQAFAPVRWILT